MDINDLEPVTISQLKKKRSNYIYKLDTDKPELNHIFAKMEPTKDIPFISWNNISKIYRGFEYTEVEGGVSTKKDSIQIKFNRSWTKLEDSINYGFAKILVNPMGLIVLIQMITEKKSYEIETIVSHISTLTGVDLINGVERDILSEFDIPNQQFQQHVLLDMVTNDSLFIRYLAIPELLKTKKSFLTIWFYPKQKPQPPGEKPLPALTPFSFTITQQTDDDGNPYVRVRPKKKQDQQNIDLLRSTLAKLFTRYNDEEGNIASIYESLGIKQDKQLQRNAKKKGGVLRGQTKKCQDPPTSFLTEENAKETVCPDGGECDEDKIMKFPKDGDKIDGYDQLYYACIPNLKTKTKKHWVGLTRPNPSTNEDTGVPCCFVTNQKTKENSHYNNYIKGITLPSRSRTLHILGPDKILINKQQGLVNNTLVKFFLGSIDKDLVLLRNGVDPDPKSFIHCVGTCVSVGTIIIESELASKAYLAKQEMYDYSVDEISRILTDETSHIDAKMFVSLFEEIYKLNIYIFDKNGMVKPRFKNGYYKRSNKFDSIIIYEHPPSIHLNYNRYELITLSREKKNLTPTFPYDSKISELLRRKRHELTLTTINGETLPPFIDPVIPGTPMFQLFDSCGKTRIIEILTDDDQVIQIQTDPMQPIDAPELLTEINIKSSPQGTLTDDIITTSNSELCRFTKMKRLARYMIDYIMWLFQKYKYERTGEGINMFISEKIVFDPDHVYIGISQKFDEKAGMMKAGKLLINDTEIIKRVKFILQMVIMRTPKKLDNYNGLIYIPDYFNTLTDFKRNLSRLSCDHRDWEPYSYNIFYGTNALLS